MMRITHVRKIIFSFSLRGVQARVDLKNRWEALGVLRARLCPSCAMRLLGIVKHVCALFGVTQVVKKLLICFGEE